MDKVRDQKVVRQWWTFSERLHRGETEVVPLEFTTHEHEQRSAGKQRQWNRQLEKNRPRESMAAGKEMLTLLVAFLLKVHFISVKHYLLSLYPSWVKP